MDQIVPVLAVIGVRCGADAGLKINISAADLILLGQSVTDVGSQFGGSRGGVDMGQQEHESVAAVSPRGIRRTDRRLPPCGDDLQYLIADRMTELVVDVLEVVEIEKHQNDLIVTPVAVAHRAIEAVAQFFAIG